MYNRAKHPITMVSTEKDIIARCQQGDTQAFRYVVQQYQQMLLTLGLKLLGDEEEAKDMVQDTFVKAWEHMGRYDSRYAFSTWLYTIASRLSLSRLKRMRRLEPLPDDERVLQRYMTDNDSQRQLENSELAAIERTLADGLGAKQRLVFTLCHLEGWDNSEIEQITGLDARQVKSNLYAARQIVKQRLKQMGYE